MHELSVTNDGIVLRGSRIVVPSTLQQRVIDIAHAGHQGIVRTKQLLRSFVWFPCIDEKVERAIKRCRNCQANVDSQHFEPILSQPMPLEPWSELSCDFFGPLSNGKFLFVVIDDHSRYPVVKQVSSTSAKVVLPVLEEVFCMFGVPRVLRSDNGPPFSSFAFRDFARHQGFTHRRTTQLWPRANGLCERFMRCQGKVIRNAKVSGHSHEKELLEFLRTYRATPHASTGFTPNELLRATPSFYGRHRPSTTRENIEEHAVVRSQPIRRNKHTWHTGSNSARNTDTPSQSLSTKTHRRP